MEKLINILKTETKSLKEQYIQKTKEWAERYYNNVTPKLNWTSAEWCKHLGIEVFVQSNGRETFPRDFYNSYQSRNYYRAIEEARKLSKMSLETYISKEEKKAELHYESSILKLAVRIERKGLNINNLKTVTSHVGVNIDTTLTDGEKTVRAFTIIAEGPIQRPHYRYLIK